MKPLNTRIPLCSEGASLSDTNRILLFKQLFLAHGVRGRCEFEATFTEQDRIEVLPLVFGLLPRQAIFRKRGQNQIKPYIVKHLSSIGIVSVDADLIDVIKEIANQFYYSLRNSRRKWGISNLRVGNRRIYQKLHELQRNRCAVCGIDLRSVDETLDHKIPFRLLGDVPDGANWQLLCGICNRGKSSWFSGLQPPCANNWAYEDFTTADTTETAPSAEEKIFKPKETLRYCVLSTKNRCSHPDCDRTALDSELVLRLGVETGLPVMDHYQVYCEFHSLTNTGQDTS